MLHIHSARNFLQVEIYTSEPSVILVLHHLSSTVTQLASIYGAKTTNNSTKDTFIWLLG